MFVILYVMSHSTTPRQISVRLIIEKSLFSSCLEEIKFRDKQQSFSPDKTQVLDNAWEISPKLFTL